MVAAIRACASSTSAGPASSSAHESAQNSRSPALSTCRARTRLPSIPSARSVGRRMVWPAPVASAACRLPSTSVHSAGRAAVVEDRLADELDLDAPVEALDGAHEQVVGVVVGGRAGVRRDLVLVVASARS